MSKLKDLFQQSAQQYKMPRTFQETIINFISIIATSIILIILLFFKSHFSWIKIFILLTLMLAFIYILYQNLYRVNNQSTMYGRSTMRQRIYREPTFADRLTGFFENLDVNSYNQSSRNLWKIQQTYTEIIDENQRTSNRTTYSKAQSSLSDYQEQQLRRRQFNILLPQNINEMVEEIRKSIEPKNYYCLFNKEIQQVKLQSTKSKGSGSMRFFEDLAPNETYCFDDKSSKFMLTNQSDLLISDPVYAVDIVEDFLKDKIEAVTRNSHYSFKAVSEIMMKCFGLRVNFGLKQRTSNYNSKQVTMQDVDQFLVKFRKQATIYQNFKLIIPTSEFVSSYLERLTWASSNVLSLLEYIDNPCVMTLRIYINILNETFPQEDIHMTSEKSAFSLQMKKAKHAYYVHQRDKRVFFTYNKINSFKTKNPLLAVLAFFTEISKSTKYQYHDVVRNLNRGLTEKYKIA